MDEYDEQSIREYVLLESPPGEIVRHAERLTTRRIYGEPYDIWNVRTRRHRWWVITNPTNLYSQTDFPEMEVALTYHLGLSTVLAHRNAPPEEDDAILGMVEPWRRWRRARESLNEAVVAEDFQAVGLRCREALLGMVDGLATPHMVPEDQKRPKDGAFVEWSALIAGHVARGSSLHRVRSHLRSSAASAWELVGWLTHSKSAGRAEAKIVIEATEHVLTVFTHVVLDAEDHGHK
jgi:hypothetical protein